MKFANRRRVIKHEAATILFRYPRRFFFSGCIAVFLTAGSNAVLSEICNALHSVLKKIRLMRWKYFLLLFFLC